MMRRAFLVAAALLASPAAAQDHSGHRMPAPAQEVDHCAMGHLPPEQCPETAEHSEHGNAGKQEMDHSQMDHSQMDHAQMDHAQMDHSGHGRHQEKSVPGAAPEDAVPARAFEGPEHAADAYWGQTAMAAAREANRATHGDMKTGQVLFERLEARVGDGEDAYLWDLRAFYGGDVNKLVVKSEGEGAFSGELEDAEIQALYSRAITPFFDLQAGVRLDVEPETRSHLVLGLEGLAPYMLHVDGALFLSDRGDLTARLEAEYDQKLTQRLILQPRVEAEFAAQDIPERGIGAGVSKLETGLRLRYEIVRELAPYVGLDYEAKLGETADIARAGGEDPDGVRFLVGLRAWF